MASRFRVAICQPAVIYGGRLRVILGMIAAWNDLGVEPDVVTADLRIDPAGVADRYGLNLRANYRVLSSGVRLPGELAILAFNRRLRHLAGDYDLLINTGNSLYALPPQARVLTYLFYPRRDRVESDAVSIHQPEVPLSRQSRAGLERLLSRALYRRLHLQPDHRLICMTEFTRTALVNRYGAGRDAPIIYPPVDMDSFKANRVAKRRQVVSLGRFVPDKRQVVQIKVAMSLPDWPFYIVGFAGNGAYFGQCRALVEKQAMQNVHLRPDAPYTEAKTILAESRYFLHTLVAEPFGLTAVQAIAAGCLPLVHNSGGQRETVPLTRLRYDEMAEIPERLLALEAAGPAERASWLADLEANAVAQFGADVFDRRVKSIFQEYL